MRADAGFTSPKKTSRPAILSPYLVTRIPSPVSRHLYLVTRISSSVRRHPYLVTRISSPVSRHPHLVTRISSPVSRHDVVRKPPWLARVDRQLRGECALVGGPRFAAGEIGGQIRKFVQN